MFITHTNILCAPVAQLAEPSAHNRLVTGSSPVRRTISKKEIIMLKNQDFRVGDECVVISSVVPVIVTVVEIKNGNTIIVDDQIGTRAREYDQNGVPLRLSKQELFHKDAVELDEHGRILVVDYNYVKPRVQKSVVSKPFLYTWRIDLPLENNLFYEGSWEFDQQPSNEDLEKMLNEESKSIIVRTYWKEEK